MGRQETWRQSAARLRDERATKIPDAPSAGPAHHKDTKRWCKGRVGREHKIAVSVIAASYFAKLCQHCSVCGRELGHYYRRCGRRPDWVTDQLLAQLNDANRRLKTQWSRSGT